MLKTVFCTTLALVAGSAIVAYADAKDDATAAAQKLTTAGNYSWKTSVEAAGGGGGGGGGGGRRGGGGGGAVEGKTDKGITAITTAGNTPRTTYLKAGKVVSQNADGQWMTAEELAAARGAAAAGGNAGADQGAAGGRRGRGGRGGGRGAQFANYKLPSETLADMIGKTKSLASADGAIKGDLTDDAAKALLTLGGGGGRGRRGAAADANATPPEVTNPKATLTIWIKDGAVSKFSTHVTGTVSRGGNDRPVDRTSTVDITDVGSTKLDVPAEAAKKLG